MGLPRAVSKINSDFGLKTHFSYRICLTRATTASWQIQISACDFSLSPCILCFFLKQVYIARGFPSGIPFLTALQESVRGLGWPLDLLLAPIRCRYRQLQPLHYMPVPLHYIKQKEFAQLYYSHHRPTVLETVSNSSLYQRLSENQRSMQTHSRLC